MLDGAGGQQQDRRSRQQAHSGPHSGSGRRRDAIALIGVRSPQCRRRARGADDFPTTGGEPAHLTVTIDWDALRTAVGTATLNYGQQISASDARRLACDCKLIPVVLGTDSEPLDVGRTTRTAPLGIRRALIARDGGCSFPGCHRPPGICAVHHIQH